jgi:hypothetical protein
MAKDLQIREHLELMRCLPQPLARLKKSLGTVQWPGEGIRLNFPSGMELTSEQRTEIEERVTALQRLTTGAHLPAQECSKARLSLLTKLLIGFPSVGNQSDAATDARLEFYLEAIGDIAPWALDAAIKRWVRGDVENSNVDFAPSPGTLHRLCLDEVKPFTDQVVQLKRLLAAVSIERAMDPAPLEKIPSSAPRLRAIP